MIITIDGPTASGKSTVGKLLAKKLNVYYLNSGLMYRAVAYLLVNKKAYTHDQLVHPKSDDVNEILDPRRFVYMYDDTFIAQVVFDTIDITPLLKNSFIDQAASLVSLNGYVREQIDNIQRAIGHKYELVADGRDCGTKVFPDTPFKIYLTADIEERARRWQKNQAVYGATVSLEDAIHNVTMRDRRDMERKHAPLTIPKQAIVINNTDMTIEETLRKIMEFIEHTRQVRFV